MVFGILIVLSSAMYFINVYVGNLNERYQTEYYHVQRFSYHFNRMLQEQGRYLGNLNAEHRTLYHVYSINAQEELKAIQNVHGNKNNVLILQNLEAINITFDRFMIGMQALEAEISQSIIGQKANFDNSQTDSSRTESLLHQQFLQAGMELSRQVTNVNKNINTIFEVLDQEKKQIDVTVFLLINVVSSLIILVELLLSIFTVLRLSKAIRSEQLAQKDLAQLNAQLENRVQERTRQLEKSMESLRLAQDHLVESAKMAALGQLVAGVSHEINTPIGIGVTAASFLHDYTTEISTLMQKQNLKKDELDHYLDSTRESAGIILANLERAANLVKSFKQVAVDQSDDEKREFKLRDYLTQIITSLESEFKQGKHQAEIVPGEEIMVTTSPGVIAQIMTNLLLNTINHAFRGRQGGTTTISCRREDDSIHIVVSDNGAGMPTEVLRHMFEPFFTTQRGAGSMGLGMHIVYNLVTQKLHGMISAKSEPGSGTTISIRIPE